MSATDGPVYVGGGSGKHCCCLKGAKSRGICYFVQGVGTASTGFAVVRVPGLLCVWVRAWAIAVCALGLDPSPQLIATF